MGTSIKKQIVDALGQRGFWGWFHNITREEGKGDFPLHGRVFVHANHEAHSARVEWNIGTTTTHAYITSDPSEGEIKTSLALPGVALYFAAGSYNLLGGLTKLIGHKTARVSVHDGAVWWETPLADPDGGPSDEPWYVRGNFDFVTALFGEQEVVREIVSEPEWIDVEIPMPEGSYKAKVKLERVGTKRARGLTQKTLTFAEVDIPGGLPIPGKGENSYDCDEDAILKMSCEARSVPDAIGAVVSSALVTRWKRGGADWRPEKAPKSDTIPSPAPHVAESETPVS